MKFNYFTIITIIINVINIIVVIVEFYLQHELCIIIDYLLTTKNYKKAQKKYKQTFTMNIS